METRRRNLYLILGAAALALAAAGVLAYPRLKAQWQKPLGPALGLATRTPTTAPTQGPTEPLSTLESGATSSLTATATLVPTATPKPLCGGPPQMTILAIGTDSRVDDYTYGLADVVRVVQVDFTIPRVAVLTIPRDLWVEIPGISDHYGITHGKVNQSYFYGTPGMNYYEGPGQGAGLLAQTLDLNFGIQAEHYISVNMVTMEDIIDAVGGIDIYLPEPVDGTYGDKPEDDMGYFDAGWHHLTGEKAVKFSRIRKVDSAFARQDRQSQVLCALREKALSPSVVTDIPEIIAAFKDRVLTDLSLQQLSQLACLAPQVNSENIVFAKFPEEVFTPGRVYSPQQKDSTFILEADYEVLRDYAEGFFAGTWPDQPKEPTCQ